MPNAPRLSTEIVERIEGVMDALQEAHTNDGEVTTDEVYAVMTLLWETYQASMHMDESLRLTVTGIRRGVDSPDYRRQVRTLELERQRREDARPRLVVLKGGKRDENPNPAA